MSLTTIIIEPMLGDEQTFNAKDVFQHAIDFLDLLSSEKGEPSYNWKLQSVTQNSPIKIIAQAIPENKSINITALIHNKNNELSRTINNYTHGVVPERSTDKTKRNKLIKAFHRNQTAIGRTQIFFDSQNEPAIIITPTLAKTALETIEKNTNTIFDFNRARKEFGSIEGVLIEGKKHNNFPSIKIRERKSKDEIWCKISDNALATSIADHANLIDLWSQKRVSIKGIITYNKEGRIETVDVKNIKKITPRKMTLIDIQDDQFTNGLSPEKYLNILHKELENT